MKCKKTKDDKDRNETPQKTLLKEKNKQKEYQRAQLMFQMITCTAAKSDLLSLTNKRKHLKNLPTNQELQ